MVLEIVFSDSIKGSVRVAKTFSEIDTSNCAVGYIGDKPSEEYLQDLFKGQAIGGDSRDVCYIGFALDMGDISSNFDGVKRQEVYKNIWSKFDVTDDELKDFFNNQESDMNKLLHAVENNIPIRIWTSEAPYSMCGLYFICDLLRDVECNVHIIKLPRYNPMDKNKVSMYSDWGQVNAGDFYRFLDLERQLSKEEINLYSDLWRNLVLDNSSLRAVVNGKLISVNDDFYDFLILRYFKDEDIMLGRLIGSIMLANEIGVSDGWYAMRIDKMIEEGKIIIVDIVDDSHPYGKLLRLA